MPLNPYLVNIFIDSCAFDPKYEPEASFSEQIFKLYEEDKIILVIAHSNMKEMEHPNTPPHVKKEALSKLYTIETGLTDEERMRKQKIWDILTGNGKPEKMEQDAKHVFEAHKYGGYFVTTDGRILDKREEIQKISNVHIALPSELLNFVNRYKSV